MFALCEALQTSKPLRSHGWDVRFYDLPLRVEEMTVAPREKMKGTDIKNRQVSKKAE
jgi:hypothetical protein